MKVVIAKVDQAYFDGEAVSVTVPGAEGEMTILSNHEALVTTLRPGRITVRTDANSEQMFEIMGGVLEVGPAGATIIL